ncbi:unnamed protein product [Rotaria sordida]|uniref:Uncharacterized protein n=1 Tax=Rotaria sordida TaxID=392033 RepID=A0A819SUT4_9BILA|nr:unnamed protein product [Rotaria sordida]CAF3700809.1 unnamed protein product [Rotaria sordida]CAF4070845.1 unnamed protein product [Rotaria sordida]
MDFVFNIIIISRPRATRKDTKTFFFVETGGIGLLDYGEGDIGLFDSGIAGTGGALSCGAVSGCVNNYYICRTSSTTSIKFIIIFIYFFLVTSKCSEDGLNMAENSTNSL